MDKKSMTRWIKIVARANCGEWYLQKKQPNCYQQISRNWKAAGINNPLMKTFMLIPDEGEYNKLTIVWCNDIKVKSNNNYCDRSDAGRSSFYTVIYSSSCNVLYACCTFTNWVIPTISQKKKKKKIRWLRFHYNKQKPEI